MTAILLTHRPRDGKKSGMTRPKLMKNRIALSLPISKETVEQLDLLLLPGQSRSAFIRDAIERVLKEKQPPQPPRAKRPRK